MEAASTLWCTHEVRQSRQSSYEEFVLQSGS